MDRKIGTDPSAEFSRFIKQIKGSENDNVAQDSSAMWRVDSGVLNTLKRTLDTLLERGLRGENLEATPAELTEIRLECLRCVQMINELQESESASSWLDDEVEIMEALRSLDRSVPTSFGI